MDAAFMEEEHVSFGIIAQFEKVNKPYAGRIQPAVRVISS